MRFLFVMDPISGVQIHLDSTFAIMLDAQERGHEVNYCLVGHLRLEDGVPWATIQRCTLEPVQDRHYHTGPPFEQPLRELDAIFMRKDPPFNMEYIFATYILEAASPDALVLNRPASLRSHNEKLYSLQFADYCPESLVSSRAESIIGFQGRLGGPMVIKPLDGNGGEGIFIVQPDDPNRNVIIEQSTRHGARPIICQRYLPEARQGDKRVLIVDGHFQGAVLRVPGSRDPRGNLHVGATSERTALTPREVRLVAEMGPRLVEDGHLFVGLDIIGEHLTEVNVTSPTGIHEVNALEDRCVQRDIVVAMERWVEKGIR